MIIGKIPGYNSYITKNSNGIDYQSHLLQNLTVAEFSPIGYSINLNGLAGSSLYKIASDTNISTNLANYTNEKLNTANGISAYTALKQWKAMQAAAGETTIRESFTILCTNDSTFNETLSNQYDMNFLEKIGNKISDSSAGQMLGGASRFSTSMDTTAALGILETARIVGNTIGSAGADMSTVLASTGVANLGTGQAWNLLMGRLIGIQSALPKIWRSSSYNNTSSFTIKLVSPSGHPDDVDEFVVKPLKHLLLAASPVTFDGIMYGYPPLWKVEAKGLSTTKLAAITTISISRGGPDTVFNRYNQPTNIDVRIVVEPIIDGFATPMDASITEDAATDGSVKLIVQNPKGITSAMLQDTIKNTSIELTPLSLLS